MDDNTVFIGKKDTMTYVYSVQTQAKSFNEISIRARGKSINKACDVALICVGNFLEDWKIKSIDLKTESRPEDENLAQKISVIEIHISK